MYKSLIKWRFIKHAHPYLLKFGLLNYITMLQNYKFKYFDFFTI